jgi:hypothetical protein
MHLLKQLFWFKVLTVAAVIAFIGFLAFTFSTVAAAHEATGWVKATTDRLSFLTEAHAAVNRAEDAAGRVMINPSDVPVAQMLRQDALARIDHLIAVSGDAPRTAANLQSVRNALIERFDAQDQQIASIERDGTRLIFNLVDISRAMEANRRIRDTFTRTRVDEHALLIERTGGRMTEIMRGLIASLICSALSILCSLAVFAKTQSELTRQRQIADHLKHLQENPKLLNEKWFDDMIDFIEQRNDEGKTLIHVTRLFL